MAERILGNMKVGEVHRLIVEEAATIGPDSHLDELFAKIVEDPRTRHVYVVDKDNILVGSVGLNAVLKRLFPMMTASSIGQNKLLDLLGTLSAERVEDIMDANPAFVSEKTPVSEAVDLMVTEQVNELPVVDDRRRVVGEINFLEIIAAYLKVKRTS